MSHPSRLELPRLTLEPAARLADASDCDPRATLASSSSFSHSSSSSISDGFSRPPTLLARSRSCSLAALAACSRSSANNSALSPENSLSEMRKSRRMSLKRVRSPLLARRPSMKFEIWMLSLLARFCDQADLTYVCRFGNALARRLPTKFFKKSRFDVPAGAMSGV